MTKYLNQLTLVCFSVVAVVLFGCSTAPAEPAQIEPVAAEAQAIAPATPTAAPANTPVPAPTSTRLPTEIIEEPVSPVAPAQEDTAMPNVLPGSEPAAKAAIEDLSRQQNIPTTDISVTSVEAVEWSDTSLGCPQEGFMYAQVITPGYLIMLEAQGQSFEYHTDLPGKSVVLCQK